MRDKPRDGFRTLVTITKNGESQTYQLFPTNPDPEIAPRAWRFRRLSSDGKTVTEIYDVAQVRGEPGLQCSCRGFESAQAAGRRQIPPNPYRACKHIYTLLRLIGGNTDMSLTEPAPMIYLPNPEPETEPQEAIA